MTDRIDTDVIDLDVKESYSVETLGYINTCFPEKFGIPRQPALAPSAKGELILLPPFNNPDCVDGLSQSSHVWLTFVFHQHRHKKWKDKVRPPRLGGNKKCGVFASRSSFRPNFLGLSAVKLESVTIENNQTRLLFSGVDLLDGTPIVDIKPYIPYSDSIPSAVNTLADISPTIYPVIFNSEAKRFCTDYGTLNNGVASTTTGTTNKSDTNNVVDGAIYRKTGYLEALLIDVLQQDPRPAYQAIDETRHYRMKLVDVDVEWRCCLLDGRKIIEVLAISVIS